MDEFVMKFGKQVITVNQDEALGSIIIKLIDKNILTKEEVKDALMNCNTVRVTKAPVKKKVRIVEVVDEE